MRYMIEMCYIFYAAYLFFCWCIYSDDYNKTHIEWWYRRYVTDKQLVILTLGFFIFPPFIVPYWIIKMVTKIIYKTFKNMKRILSSDSPWWY